MSWDLCARRGTRHTLVDLQGDYDDNEKEEEAVSDTQYLPHLYEEDEEHCSAGSNSQEKRNNSDQLLPFSEINSASVSEQLGSMPSCSAASIRGPSAAAGDPMVLHGGTTGGNGGGGSALAVGSSSHHHQQQQLMQQQHQASASNVPAQPPPPPGCGGCATCGPSGGPTATASGHQTAPKINGNSGNSNLGKKIDLLLGTCMNSTFKALVWVNQSTK